MDNTSSKPEPHHRQSSSNLISDNQSLSSHQQSEVSMSKKKTKKSKEEEATQAVLDKKKLRVLKDGLKDLKQKYAELMEENKKMKTAKEDAEREMEETKKTCSRLFDENSELTDKIHDLQQKMADEFGIMTGTGDDAGEPSPQTSSSSPKHVEPSSKPEPKPEKKKNKKKHEETVSAEDLLAQEALDEQALIEQKNASNLVAMELAEQSSKNEELHNEIGKLKEDVKILEDKCEEYAQEIKELKEVEICNLQDHIDEILKQKMFSEEKETEAYTVIEMKNEEIKDLQAQILSKEEQLEKKQAEFEEQERQILKYKDKIRDIEAKFENNQGQEHNLQEEIIILQDKLNGKDTAISQLSTTLKVTSKENDRLKDMVDMFKHKLVIENSFNLTYGGQKLKGGLPMIKPHQDLIIGFVRDQEDAEEFYLQIAPKGDLSKAVRIPTADIDEIEHVEGTFQFYVHYQQDLQAEADSMQASKGKTSIGDFLKKKLNKQQAAPKNQVEDRNVLLESKFVKQIIEAFNNVLELEDQQEAELSEYLGKQMNGGGHKKAEVKSINAGASMAKPVQRPQEIQKTDPVIIENYVDKVKSQPTAAAAHHEDEEEYEYDEEYDDEEEGAQA